MHERGVSTVVTRYGVATTQTYAENPELALLIGGMPASHSTRRRTERRRVWTCAVRTFACKM